MDATLLGLTTPTLTLRHTFIFNFFIISFIFLQINAFPMRYEIWKGRKKVQQKGGSNSGRSRPYIYATETEAEGASFLVLTNPLTRWWAELV